MENRLEAKIAELEKRIRELEGAKQIDRVSTVLPGTVPESPPDIKNTVLQSPNTPEAATGAAPGGDPPRTASGGLSAPAFGGFKDGFVLRSADGQHQMRITGQIQADYRIYPRHGDFTDTDTFLLRRARFGIEANLFNHYEFRFLPDFGNGNTAIQDAYMNVHYWDALQFQVGKFKEPVSYEQLIQDRFVPTLERSLIDQMVPARDFGVMIHGQKLLCDQLDYALGAFNGVPNENTVDTNKIRDFAGRIAWRPLHYEQLPEWVQYLQIGVSGTTGKEQEALNFNSSGTPNVLRTPGNVPWLTFNSGARADGVRTRITPEVSYFYNSLGFAAQYLRMDQDIRPGVPTVVVKGGKVVSISNDPVQDVRFEGYYFLTTYLVTGEKRTTYSQAVVPLRPFDAMHPFCNPGAWELVARVSHLQVDPSIFQSSTLFNLADPKKNSDAATELTVGFNWYLNSLVRMQFNWEHAWFQQSLLLGPPSMRFSQTDAALVRFQIIF